MNKQEGPSRIEWCSHSWNPISGCRHRCRWSMGSNSQAVKCYAEEVAQGVARKAYPNGFEHHYWHPDRLDEPLKVKEPSKIFVTSMGDLMGSWVPRDQIQAVIQTMRRADGHQFQILTKAPKRLLPFDWPKNAWLGVSMPPDAMNGLQLSGEIKTRMMGVAFDALAELKARGHITFMSFEPLAWDVAPLVKPDALSWAIIGAASHGAKVFQPDLHHLAALRRVLQGAGVAIFLKGNLRMSVPYDQWLEEFPAFEQVQPAPEPEQLNLFAAKPLPTPAEIAAQINAEMEADTKGISLEEAERVNNALIAAAPKAAVWAQRKKLRQVIDDETVRELIRRRLETRAGLAA